MGEQQPSVDQLLSENQRLQERIQFLESQLETREQLLETSEIDAFKTATIEIRSLEQALEVSENRLMRLLETASIAILVIDEEGEILIVNQKAEEIFGYHRNQLIGTSINRLLPENLRESHEVHLKRFFSNPHPRAMGQGLDLIAQHRNGEHFPIEASLSTMETDRGTNGVAFIVDISERKRGETHRLALLAERERTEILQNFITDVAHDIKTPITTMKTNLYLLQRKLDLSQFPQVSTLNTQVTHLNSLVDGMLEMTRIDQLDELDFEEVDLNQIVHDLVESYREHGAQKDQAIELNVEADTLLMQAEPTELATALEQILMNAHQYTPHGGRITVRVSRSDEQVTVHVEDTGIGMDAPHMARIFERFYRVDEARTVSDSGSGLGLSIALRIIQLHGGTIEVESKLEKGSHFRVMLPIEQHT